MKIRIKTDENGFYQVQTKESFFSSWCIQYICTNKEDAFQRLKECKKRLIEIKDVYRLGVIYEENLNEQCY